MKRCKRCNTVKNEQEFYTLKDGTLDAWCKQCRSDYKKEKRVKKVTTPQSRPR